MLTNGAAMASSSSLLPGPLLFKPPHPTLPFRRTTPRFSLSSSPAAVTGATPPTPGPVVKKRTRYRKLYPGESKGIVEEMRFVAMKLRNTPANSEEEAADGGEEEMDTWRPSMEGFVKYLVDSKLVFDTLERIVDKSDDVAYAYFRKTGLERSASLSQDLDWFREKGIVIPGPRSPGTNYAAYLDELAEKSAPSFLCHFYNIYFAHISGGQGIGKQVCEELLEGKELEFYKWEGDVQELLKDVREKLNKLGEHWTRDVKNRCLREASKSFRYSGQDPHTDRTVGAGSRRGASLIWTTYSLIEWNIRSALILSLILFGS